MHLSCAAPASPVRLWCQWTVCSNCWFCFQFGRRGSNCLKRCSWCVLTEPSSRASSLRLCKVNKTWCLTQQADVLLVLDREREKLISPVWFYVYCGVARYWTFAEFFSSSWPTQINIFFDLIAENIKFLL